MSRGRGRARSFARRWGAAAVLGVVTALVLVLYFTPLLGVRAVQVSGLTTLPEPQVLAEAGVPVGKSMLRVDTDEIGGRLRQDPRIAASTVSLSWPSTVQVEVTERSPAAFVQQPGGVRLADAQGVLFASAPAPPPGLLELRMPKPDDASARAAMSVVSSLPPDLRSQVSTVDVSSPREVRLELAGNRQIVWGEANQADRKAAVLPLLLTRPGHVFDVTSPVLPTVS